MINNVFVIGKKGLLIILDSGAHSVSGNESLLTNLRNNDNPVVISGISKGSHSFKACKNGNYTGFSKFVRACGNRAVCVTQILEHRNRAFLHIVSCSNVISRAW